MKTIEVIIDEKGDATIQTSGFVGAECAKETASLEKALGVKTRDTKTPEYHRASRGVINQ